MKYTVTPEDINRMQLDYNKGGKGEEGMRFAIQGVIDRIPEPAAASPPEWIKLGDSYINLRHVVAIELTDKFAYDFRFANGEMRRVDVRQQDASVHNTERFIMGPWVLRDQS